MSYLENISHLPPSISRAVWGSDWAPYVDGVSIFVNPTTLRDPSLATIVKKFSMASSVADAGTMNGQFNINREAVAANALDQSGSILQRMGQLAVRAGDGTLSAADRKSLQAEASQLQDELGDLLNNASFNGQPVLEGDTVSLEVSGPLSYSDGNGNAILNELTNIDLTTQTGAQSSLGQIQSAQAAQIRERVHVETATASISTATDLSQVQSANMEHALSSTTARETASAVGTFMQQLGQDRVRSQIIRLHQLQVTKILGIA